MEYAIGSANGKRFLSRIFKYFMCKYYVYALELSCLTLLSLCSFPGCYYFFGNLLKLEQISNTLNWRSALMSCMICLNNLKLNMKTYISYIIYMYIYETYWNKYIYETKIILPQLKVYLKLRIIIIKIHSNTVLMKKQQNFQIRLEFKRQR